MSILALHETLAQTTPLINVGETVEIVCSATGLVPPRVEWFTEDGLGGDGAFASGTGLAVARLNVTASPQR